MKRIEKDIETKILSAKSDPKQLLFELHMAGSEYLAVSLILEEDQKQIFW